MPVALSLYYKRQAQKGFVRRDRSLLLAEISIQMTRRHVSERDALSSPFFSLFFFISRISADFFRQRDIFSYMRLILQNARFHRGRETRFCIIADIFRRLSSSSFAELDV